MTTKQSTRIKSKRKPGDPWVSKNRVLNPSKSKRSCPIYRNPNFDTDETKMLIQLWGDPKVQRELITTHKKHVVIAQLAAKMEEYGYYRSPEEITTRIKNMKCFYNRLKKEMEVNKNLDPSWRHYADMEAIMTRPIFSVRPNEVPTPSLKYLMEQEEEKRRERRRKAAREGDADVSDSDDDIEDVLAMPVSRRSSKGNDSDVIEPHAEIELEVDDETLAAIEKGADQRNQQTSEPATNKDKNQLLMEDEMMIKMEIESEEFQTVDEQGTPSKSKDTTSKDSDCELLIPKVEPIDVDDDSQNNDQTATNNQMNSAPHLVGILNQPTKSQNGPTITFPKYSMSQNCSTNTITVTSTASPATPSKISVVSPTILMPPASAGQSAILSTQSPRQMRIGGNLQALLTTTGPRQTVTATNGMKFILVNATDRRGLPITTSTLPPAMSPTSSTTMQSNVNNVQQSQPAQQSQKHTTTNSQARASSSPKANIQTNSTRKRLIDSLPDRDTLRRRELAGIKSTLHKLLKAKDESNEIESQRLALERERLQFERTIAEKFLDIFEQNQKIQQQLMQQQQQQQQQQQKLQVQQRTTQQLFTTTNATGNAMQNSGQLMMPPKLLITTMVPTSSAAGVGAGAAGGGLASTVLTAANFKNLTTANVAVDKPLLIPKEEPDN